MTPERVLRFELPGRIVLNEMVERPLPFGLHEETSHRQFFRVVFFETLSGDLEHKGATVRLHIDDKGTQTLFVDVRDHQFKDGTIQRHRAQAEVTAIDPAVLFSGTSEPAQMVRAMIDPRRLTTALELEVSRRERIAKMKDGATVKFAYDDIMLRRGEVTGELFELEVCLPTDKEHPFEGLVQELEEKHQARLTLAETVGRARDLLRRLEVERLEIGVKTAREVAVVAYNRGRISLLRKDGQLLVPTGPGTGQESVRRVLAEHFGRPYGRIRYLGTTAGTETHPSIETWLAEDVAHVNPDRIWTRLDDVLNMVGSSALRDSRTLIALNAIARSDLASRGALRSRIGPLFDEEEDTEETSLFESTVYVNKQRTSKDLATKEVGPELMLNPEISRLLFDERILSIVESKDTPLLERVKFLSMFWTRLDDFFMTRIAEFQDQVAENETGITPDGLTAVQQLEVTRLRARHLSQRAYGYLTKELLPALESNGIRIMRWDDLDEAERDYLRDSYQARVEAVITPVIADPTHPFPHIRNLRPAIAAFVRLPESTREHFVAIQLPGELPRFIPLKGGRSFIPLEEVILAMLPNLYRGLEVVRAHTFRITRSGNLDIAEEPAGGILSAVEAEVARRPFGEAVRLEVDSAMPTTMRDWLFRELQFETPDTLQALSESDIYTVERLVDLVALKEIAALEIPELKYPPAKQNTPLDPERSIFEQMREKDHLVCFPFDSFDQTVERFISDAAEDDDVVSIKVTLYRTDAGSRIVQALAKARTAGKDAFALVELKASFDERRNVEWARSLEAAGVHVVFSPVAFKVHAKTALVVRREKEGVQRYAYIGTGNLNAATARGYTDLGIFTTDPELTEEVNAVFNLLTGYSAGGDFKHLLVSPFNMRARFVEMVEREMEHAKAGKKAHIRLQLNGLADRRMISVLYRAAEAGVRCELAVREICCIRPGIPGISDNITVVSKLGRFLQHARIYYFYNDGDPEYFIGSADWRPRNLSKRVEVVTPIRDPEHRKVLDGLLDSYLNDPDVWQLAADGAYRKKDEYVGGGAQPPKVDMNTAAD
ncbi:MAG TPA: polyphosphate kinase 1 [Longimicrobiales bacterium]|nr:polyphosphate kinase 1 [Longimicrobiales bacterium]